MYTMKARPSRATFASLVSLADAELRSCRSLHNCELGRPLRRLHTKLAAWGGRQRHRSGSRSGGRSYQSAEGPRSEADANRPARQRR